jgi:hypothetical protein
MSEINRKLQAELYRALQNLGASADLLAVIGSIDDTMTQEECADDLERYNETGSIWDSVHCSIPQVRRKRAIDLTISLNEDGPYIDFKTKDGSQASINLRVYAQEHNDSTLLTWCEEQLGRPLYRRLQVVAENKEDPQA